MRRRRKRLSGLDKYVIFSIAVLLSLAMVELVVSTVTGVSHDTLVTAVYACFGGEILSCALIKIFKLRETHGDGDGVGRESPHGDAGDMGHIDPDRPGLWVHVGPGQDREVDI